MGIRVEKQSENGPEPKWSVEQAPTHRGGYPVTPREDTLVVRLGQQELEQLAYQIMELKVYPIGPTGHAYVYYKKEE